MTLDPARTTRPAPTPARDLLDAPAGGLVLVFAIAAAFGGAALPHLGDVERDLVLAFIFGYAAALLLVLPRIQPRRPLAPNRPHDDAQPDAAAPTSEPARLTAVSPPSLVEPVVHGDDFVMIDCVPPANHGPRPRPGFWTRAAETYYVTRRHDVYLLRSPAHQAQITRVAALPDGCTPIASQHCDPTLCILAEVADARAG